METTEQTLSFPHRGFSVAHVKHNSPCEDVATPSNDCIQMLTAPNQAASLDDIWAAKFSPYLERKLKAATYSTQKTSVLPSNNWMVSGWVILGLSDPAHFSSGASCEGIVPNIMWQTR